MNKEIIEKYKKAGEIAKEVKVFAKNLVKENASVLDIANAIEAKIKELGGEVAFPLNISINEVAAHYVPSINDKKILQKDDLVKIDIGVHIDGYIADTAISFSIGDNSENKKLISAAEEGLNAAIKLIKPGVSVSEIGSVINEKISSAGFQPIRNLTGHNLDQYEIHSGLTIPNYNNGSDIILEEGDVIAIEPFATNGAGIVVEGRNGGSFSLIENAVVRQGRDIMKHIQTEYKTLPFAKRWLDEKFGLLKTNLFLNSCVRKEIIKEYKMLKEQNNGKVAQAEHTIIVLDKPIIIT